MAQLLKYFIIDIFLEGKYGVYHIQFFLIDLSIKFYNGSFTSNEIKFYHFE